jgi:hypothetical protein
MTTTTDAPSKCAHWTRDHAARWDVAASRVLDAARDSAGNDELADALDEIRLNLLALARADRATDSAREFYASAVRTCIAMVDQFPPDDDVNRAAWAGRAAAYSDAARVLDIN